MPYSAVEEFLNIMGEVTSEVEKFLNIVGEVTAESAVERCLNIMSEVTMQQINIGILIALVSLV